MHFALSSIHRIVGAQANVFYSCAVDNIIKIWDWKDGTCLGTMHGHCETVANLCLTPEGTLFSSGIDKMVKSHVGACTYRA